MKTKEPFFTMGQAARISRNLMKKELELLMTEVGMVMDSTFATQQEKPPTMGHMSELQS